MCDRCEELEEELRQLREAFSINITAPPQGYGPIEWAIYRLLSERGSATHRQIDMALTHAGSGAERPKTLVKVLVSRLNRKLADKGERITGVNRQGYVLERGHAH